jgi:hypothetical protein
MRLTVTDEEAIVSEPITITAAGRADREELERLAELDSRHAPVGPALIARVDGQLRAAVGVEDGSAVADPFHPTADLVRVLRAAASRGEGINQAA